MDSAANYSSPTARLYLIKNIELLVIPGLHQGSLGGLNHRRCSKIPKQIQRKNVKSENRQQNDTITYLDESSSEVRGFATS